MPTAFPPIFARVPRPPRPFLGRESELVALEEAFGRGPLGIVCGLSGIGKSAVVRAFVAADEARGVTAVHVGFSQPTARVDGLLLLARAVGLPHPGTSADETAPDLLFDSVFERAEEARLWVVLDDVHAWDGAEDLLEIVLQFAERSRWLVTSRLAPRSHPLRRSTLVLQPMAVDALAELAAGIHPGASRVEIERLAAGARGSPRGLQLLSSKRPGGEQALPWAGLDGVAARCCELVAAASEGVTREELQRAEPASDGVLDLLERAGLVDINDRIRITSAVALQISEEQRASLARAHLRTLVDALLPSEASRSKLSAIALAKTAGDDALVHALALGSVEGIVSDGGGLKLFDLLDGYLTPAVREVRIIAAASTGVGRALTWATAEDRPASFAARHAWISAIAFTGAPEKALAHALELEAEAYPDELPHTARLIGRISRILGRPAVGIEALRAAGRSADPRLQVPNDGLEAVLLAMQGRRDEAIASIHRVEAEVGLLPPSEQGFPFGLVASAFYLLGHLSRALEVANEAARRLPTLRATSWWLAQHTSLSLDAGDLELVTERHEDDRARASERDGARLSSHLEGYRVIRELRLALALGAPSVVERLDAVRALIERSASQEVGIWAQAYGVLAAIVLGVGPESGPTSIGPMPTHPARRIRGAYERMRNRRFGIPSTMPVDDPEAAVDVRLVELREQAEAVVIEQRLDDAERLLKEAQRLALQHAWALHAADLAALRGDVAVIAGRGARSHVEDLRRILPTPRYEAEATFLTLASAPALDVTALAELARTSTSPVARRRARAIVLGEPLEDEIDRLVVARLRSRDRGGPHEVAREPGPKRARWTLDESTHEMVLGNGRRVSFGRNEVLWRLMTCLASRPVCSKEDLVTTTWSTGYHPLRDDARLRVALARLRKLLADEPGAPANLVATEGGYRIVDREEPGAAE